MARRWFVPLATLGLVFGSMVIAAGAASASPASHPTIHSASMPVFRPGGRMIRPGGVARVMGHGANTTAQSTNWSGFAVTGGTGAFTSVSASWTQPAVTCPRHGQQFSSFWAGLDGFNSNSVEQTGTEGDCNRGTANYFGWFEMFPAFPVNFSNPVQPGDSISASVTFSGTETFTLVLHDATQGWTQNIVQNQTGLTRSSAEVISEAPSSNSGVLPLANFGTVNYSASSANGTSLGTQNPIQITMVNNSGAAKDSTSSISSGGAFSNTWIRSN
jgi:hypothetical protein